MSDPAVLAPQTPPQNDWLSREELAALTPETLVSRARALTPLLSRNAMECERLRRPVNDCWDAIRKTGVFYHFVPKRYGGLEFDIDTFIDAMMPLGEGCASTGWVASFCVEHNWMLSQFAEEAQAEIFGKFPYIIAPGVTQPPGKAVRVKGGYRLTGHWKWGTGVMHADWVLATGIDPEGPNPPAVMFFAMPVSDVEILDTWRVDGMVGTGSNDIRAKDIFVPEHRMLDFGHMREGCAPGSKVHDNPIYKMAMLPFLALTATAPVVGTARGAVECFRQRLSERGVFGSELKHADKPAAQMRLAMADMKVRNAELLLRDAGRRNVALGAIGKPVSAEDRIALRLQVAYAMHEAREAVRIVCEASGASAHYTSNPLQRALRDLNTAASHVVFDLDMGLELRGRSMIGLPPNFPLI